MLLPAGYEFEFSNKTCTRRCFVLALRWCQSSLRKALQIPVPWWKGEPLGGGNRNILTCLLKKKVFTSNHLQKCNGHFHLYSFDYLAIFEACWIGERGEGYGLFVWLFVFFMEQGYKQGLTPKNFGMNGCKLGMLCCFRVAIAFPFPGYLAAFRIPHLCLVKCCFMASQPTPPPQEMRV